MMRRMLSNFLWGVQRFRKDRVVSLDSTVRSRWFAGGVRDGTADTIAARVDGQMDTTLVDSLAVNSVG